ncbi:unnamed protein product [Rotaria sp. Silwood1]|nr:unnamed protein product [Rotaria sp. Silwood1]
MSNLLVIYFINNESKYSLKIIQTLETSHLLDYCSKQNDIETQYYVLALINIIMIMAMSNTIVSIRLRELVQSIVTSHLTRSSLVQQLCLLQRFYLNELYTDSMNTSPDQSHIKYRDMISKLRRNAFDTDLLLSDQSCQDLSFRVSSVNTNEIIPISTINPRRFVLENSCKTLQQHCPLVKSSIEVSSVVHQQICQSLDDICLINKTISSSLNQLSLLPITKSLMNTSLT